MHSCGPLALWVTNSPRDSEYLSLMPGTGIYIVAWMTTLNGVALSLGPICQDILLILLF